MTEPTLNALMQRLDTLERKNRNFRHLLYLMVLGASAIIVMGQASPQPRIVEAERFIVKDSTGIKAVLGAGPSQEVILAFVDRSGRPRVSLTLDADGFPMLTLSGRTAKEGLSLNVLSTGLVALNLTDMNGNAPIGMAIGPGGTPLLSLADPKGRLRVAIALEEATKPSVQLYDENSEVRARLSIADSNGVSLALTSRSGDPLSRCSCSISRDSPSPRRASPCTTTDK